MSFTITQALHDAFQLATERSFDDWIPWKDRENYRHIKRPGVYVLAHQVTVPDTADPLSPDVIYVGETSQPFRVRWKAFESSALGGKGHGGGDTYHVKFGRPRRRLRGDLYV
ncbi:MAG: hypothetical protein ACREER_08105, partial [Alphaproteobacteria bacterium]